MKKFRYTVSYTMIGIFFVSFFLPLTVGAEDWDVAKCRRDGGKGVSFSLVPGANHDQECTSVCANQTPPSGMRWAAYGWNTCCCENTSPITCPAGKKCLSNPLGTTTNAVNIPVLIGNVLKGLFGIIGTIALVMVIFGGFMWMTAFGEESKVKKGWDTMIWAAMGLAVMFGSYIAVDFIHKAILGS